MVNTENQYTTLFTPNSPYQPPPGHPLIHSTDVAELHREATRYKDEGNWTAALACLLKVKELNENNIEDFPRRLRLPLFLQQAGHFEAAKYELVYLLENIDRFVVMETEHSINPALSQTFVRSHHLERLFDKARLIYQREKQTEPAQTCRQLSEEYQARRKAASEALLREDEKRREEHRRRYPDRPASTSSVEMASSTYAHNRPSRGRKKPHRPNSGCLNSIAGIVAAVITLWLLF